MELPLKGIKTGKVRRRRVFVYIMHEDRPLGLPSRSYMETCRQGYRSFGFDEGSWNGRMPTARRGRRRNFRAGGRRGTPASW